MAFNFSVALRASENISAPFRRAADSAQQMADANDRMSASARSAGHAFIGLTTVVDAAVGVIAVQAAKLEDALARLSISTESSTQSTATSLNNAEAAARDFSTKFTASAAEVIRAQVEIAQAGIPVEEQLAATQGAFKLAQATMGDFTGAAQLLGSFLNTFGKAAEFGFLNPAEKIESITDRLSRVVQRFQVTLPVLAESFKFVVGPASQLELKLSEVSVALGILNTAGFRGSLAGTALSNMFNKLDRAVEKLDLNPERFIDLNGNLKDLASFLMEVNRSLADKTPIEAQNKLIEVFDIRAGRVIKTLLNNIDALKKYTAELEIARGVTEQMAGTLQSTTSSQFKQFINAIENSATAIGSGFNDQLRSVLPSLNSFARGLSDVATEYKGVIAGAATVAAGVLTLSTVLITGTFIATRVAGTLREIAAASSVAATAVGTLQIGFTIIKLAGVFTAVAAGGYLLSEGIKSAASALTGNGGIIAAIALTTSGAALLGVGIRSLVAAFQGFAALSAAGTALGGLLGLLQRVGGILGRIVVVVGGAVAIFATFKSIINSLVDAISGVNNTATRTPKTIDEISRSFGSGSERTSKFANELERLGKALRSNLDVPVARTSNLGDLPLSNKTEELFSKGQMKLSEAIAQATKDSGGFIGVIKQTAEALGNGVKSTVDYAKAFEDLRGRTDPLFKDLNDLEKASEFYKSGILGASIATRAFGKSAEETTQALSTIESSFNRLKGSDSELTRKNFLTNLFETIANNVDNLRRVDLSPVQDIVKIFDDARKAVSDKIAKENRLPTPEEIDFKAVLTIDSKEFSSILPKIEQITSSIHTATFAGQLFGEALRAVDVSAKSITNNGKAVENFMKNASLGGESFSSAIKNSEERIASAREGLKAFDFAVANLKERFDRFGAQFIDTQEFRDAKNQLDSLLETRVQLIAQIDEAQVRTQSDRIFAIIDRANKTLSKQQVTDIKKIGEAFGDSIGSIFTGKLTGKDAFTKLANEFKQLFVADVQKEIGLLIGDKFKDDFRAAILAAQGAIEELNGTVDLFAALQSGDLASKINDAVKAAVPGIDKITGGDIFDIGKDSKLSEKFKDIVTDIQVALVTASGASFSLLDSLERIVNTGPGKTFEQLVDQATKLRELLKEASRTGSNDAIRPIESALKTVLDELNNGKSLDPSQRIADATKDSASALTISANAVADAIATILPISTQFVDNIKNGLLSTIDAFSKIDLKLKPTVDKEVIDQQKVAPQPVKVGVDSKDIENAVKSINTSVGVAGQAATNFADSGQRASGFIQESATAIEFASTKLIEAAKQFSKIILDSINKLTDTFQTQSGALQKQASLDKKIEEVDVNAVVSNLDTTTIIGAIENLAKDIQFVGYVDEVVFSADQIHLLGIVESLDFLEDTVFLHGMVDSITLPDNRVALVADVTGFELDENSVNLVGIITDLQSVINSIDITANITAINSPETAVISGVVDELLLSDRLVNINAVVDSIELQNREVELLASVASITIVDNEASFSGIVDQLRFLQETVDLIGNVTQIQFVSQSIDLAGRVNEIEFADTGVNLSGFVGDLQFANTDIELSGIVSNLDFIDKSVELSGFVVDLNFIENQVQLVGIVKDVDLPSTVIHLQAVVNDIVLPSTDIAHILLQGVVVGVELPITQIQLEGIVTNVELSSKEILLTGFVKSIEFNDRMVELIASIQTITVPENEVSLIGSIKELLLLNQKVNLIGAIDSIDINDRFVALNGVVNELEFLNDVVTLNGVVSNLDLINRDVELFGLVNQLEFVNQTVGLAGVVISLELLQQNVDLIGLVNEIRVSEQFVELNASIASLSLIDNFVNVIGVVDSLTSNIQTINLNAFIESLQVFDNRIGLIGVIEKVEFINQADQRHTLHFDIPSLEPAINAAIGGSRQILFTVQTDQIITAITQIDERSRSAAEGIRDAALSLSQASQTLLPAAIEFGEIIKNAFDNAANSLRDTTASIGSENQILEINIATGERTINVSLDDSGLSDNSRILEEDEIREIVNEARIDLLEEVGEIVRKLENELRRR